MSLDPTNPAKKQKVRMSINTALIDAARSGFTDLVDSALEMGADANFSDAFGLTPLHLAANAGDTRMIKLLLRHGARMGGTGSAGNSNSSGLSAMCAAALNNRLDAVKLLASYAMDLEQAQQIRPGGGNHCTLLEMTLVAGKIQMATWLIDHGADIECTESNRESLIERMAVSRNEDAVLLLAASGARINVQVVSALRRMNSFDLIKKIREIQKLSGKDKLAKSTNGCISTDVGQKLDQDSIDDQNDSDHLDYFFEECFDATAELKENRSERLSHSSTRALERLKSYLSAKVYSAQESALGARRIVKKYLPTAASRALRNNDIFSKLLDQNELTKARDFLLSHELSMDLVHCSRGSMNALQLLCVSIARVCRPTAGVDFDGRFLPLEIIAMELACAIERSDESVVQNGISRAHRHARFTGTGNTVLHELIARGQSRLVMHLLALKIFKDLVNTSNDDLSRPLHLAVHRQDPHLMSALVHAGANLNAFDRQGHTPLHVAAFMLEHPCAETAVTLGANIQLSTRTGISLEQIIDQRKGQSEILKGMIQARQTIDCAKSIFSANNPMAMMVRAKRKSMDGSAEER